MKNYFLWLVGLSQHLGSSGMKIENVRTAGPYSVTLSQMVVFLDSYQSWIILGSLSLVFVQWCICQHIILKKVCDDISGLSTWYIAYLWSYILGLTSCYFISLFWCLKLPSFKLHLVQRTCLAETIAVLCHLILILLLSLQRYTFVLRVMYVRNHPVLECECL